MAEDSAATEAEATGGIMAKGSFQRALLSLRERLFQRALLPPRQRLLQRALLPTRQRLLLQRALLSTRQRLLLQRALLQPSQRLLLELGKRTLLADTSFLPICLSGTIKRWDKIIK